VNNVKNPGLFFLDWDALVVIVYVAHYITVSKHLGHVTGHLSSSKVWSVTRGQLSSSRTCRVSEHAPLVRCLMPLSVILSQWERTHNPWLDLVLQLCAQTHCKIYLCRVQQRSA